VATGTTITSSQPGAAIQELTERDVDGLRFGLWSRMSNHDVKRALTAFPGRSVWLPETLEYAIVTPWRARPEVANVAELSAVRNPALLLEAVVDRCAQLGASVVIAIELDEVRGPAFYERAGFELLEEVITYELDCRVALDTFPSEIAFRSVDVRSKEDRQLLIRLDHETFPWLWWNSEAEFLSYADTPGVELFAGYIGDDPVSYVGITSYLGWGHLDRIAVMPHLQGRGLGKQALSFAIQRLMRSGSMRVGLSTQSQNKRSQQLYERFGFRRATSNDYRLYGRVLRLPDGVRSVTEIG
jgi:ribosomal-protein-alanine N-acetyltransferase